jgi:hypothetical protein
MRSDFERFGLGRVAVVASPRALNGAATAVASLYGRLRCRPVFVL